MDVTPEEVEEAMNAAPIPQKQEVEEDDYEENYQDQQQYQQPPQPQYTSPPPQQHPPPEQRVAYSPPAQVSLTNICRLRCWFGLACFFLVHFFIKINLY